MIPFLAPLLLKLSPVGKALKAVPRPVWIALAVIALLLLGSCVHARKVKQYGEERYTAGVKAEGDRIAAKALKIAKRAEEISAKAKELNNEKNRRIAGDADAVRVSGPGKAACLNPAAPSASRPVTPAGKPDAARSEMPPGSGEALLAAVPWPWLVDRAEQCDLNRAEAETWRAWHRELTEAWQKENR
jgi:hypothetical protein